MTQTSSRLRRFPWISTALTLLVAVTALVPADAIRNAVDHGPIGDARLERSLGYTLLGPISSLFDAMTLFTVGQIIGFTVWVLVAYAVIRWSWRTGPVPLLRELGYAVGAFVGLLIVYAAAVALPRPMARLVVTRTDVISVDFHSHTKYSHDGRLGWSAADLRDWHTAAGYDVAYITDHRTFDGVSEGLRLDASFVGQAATTTLLPGIEVFFHGEHVNILNAGVRYRGLTSADFTEMDDNALAFTSAIAGAEPILIETIPGDLSMIIPADGPRSAGVRAIEIVDGSPRGMSQTKREHDRIVRIADSLNLALVAGTDNHGWGKTAPGWTLLRIPGVWRTYKPDSLANIIDDIIRQAGRGATKVVERTTADASPVAVALTMPAVLWTAARTLSPPERVAWLAWIWLSWSIGWMARRRRAVET